MSSNRRILGPFNRVEGDLSIAIAIEKGLVNKAEVTAPLFRGFERMLAGRDALDALTIVPRICGICSVSQSVAAVRALTQLFGVTPPTNGYRMMNLIHAVENLGDHLSHFYLFFMPDFARDAYADRPWFPTAVKKFKATKGESQQKMLEARALFMHLMGTLAGHWPHTLCLQPGGVTRVIHAAEQAKLLQILRQMRRYLETYTFGVSLETVCDWHDDLQLDDYRLQHPDTDFSLFLQIAADLRLSDYGRAYDRFIATSSYQMGNDTPSITLWEKGALTYLSASEVTEDHQYSWYSGDDAVSPFASETTPLPDKQDAYSWSKAPRLSGLPAETGAISRAMMSSQPLITQLVKQQGGNVFSRVVARLTEVARILPQMERWLADIQLDAAFSADTPAKPMHQQAIGFTEAARGLLGHWVTLDGRQITDYQIIAPTTWNFSPRDHVGVPGPLEKALEGLPAEDAQALMIQHVVRSFDPCQVCTTH
ncbi:nickel-dependent hydrogenase large subunit [Leeia sp. TBRC 13508]|uniref:Nickel-dependent hydrogenase large subunit n=1 Tax=Leeia speluncae TaxID=2884804 RepID=A0ABS8D2I3_9NEIS|nr:nickel-dependent hydrogenase large subunit [Leeia speluncae]MCB6182394.1 nickel-dependent hydrogenase large subunit [Leeia speluncae]